MPADGKRYEVLNGELMMAPAPNRFHQAISRNLCRIIYQHLHLHKQGRAYDAPFDVFFDDLNVAQPDLVFVATESQAELALEGVHGPPDLVVEILSPSTTRRDLRIKRALYARSRVREFWVISPETHQLQIYLFEQATDRPTQVLEEIDIATTPLMPGLQVPVGELFED